MIANLETNASAHVRGTNALIPQFRLNWDGSVAHYGRDTNIATVGPVLSAVNRQVLNVSNAETRLYISDVGSESYALRYPLMITITRHDDDEYVAAIPEAEILRSGSSPEDAVSWLKSSMVELYELFRQERKLGPLPTRQLRILGRYLAKKPRPAK